MNRRSMRTKRDITAAFLELLNEKPIRSITVKELAEKADITRATFYSHYSDVYELLDRTRAEAIEHITSLLDKTLPSGDISSFTLELFSYFDERRELFGLIMGENGDISFLVSALRELRERQVERIKENPGIVGIQSYEEDVLDYQFIYLSGGLLHMLTEWFSRNDGVPTERVAQIAAQFIESTGGLVASAGR